MHPSDAIRGRLTQLLAGKTIVIGISGSIAAVEAPRVIRELIRHGADVRAVMTPESTRIISEEALHFATGHPPIMGLTGDVEHVTLMGPGEKQADLLLVAPATANTVSKIAHGIDDTAVTSFASVALGGGVPVLVAPAMHADMARNPAIRENLGMLRKWGVGVVTPTRSEGEDKLASPDEIAAAVLHRLAEGPWKGQRVIVIGGSSHEAIDAVRSISNESSGETAVDLATQAFYRGADTELWAGAVRIPVPSFLVRRPWRSLGDLRQLMKDQTKGLRRATAVFVPAALSDFTLTPRPGKVSSQETPKLTLELRRAPKILPELRRILASPARLIGFKLEAGKGDRELTHEAEEFLHENALDVVVANDRSAMDSPNTKVIVVSARGTRQTLTGPKMTVVGKLLDDLGREFSQIDQRGLRPPPSSASLRSARLRKKPR